MIMSARPIAVAAPPMSFFISPIEAGGLMSSPPVSKQTPLPTRVTFGASARPQARSSRRGASVAAAPTAWIIGKPSRRRASPRMARTEAPWRSASARTAASSAAGPMSRAGVLMRSWVSAAAAAMRSTRAASTPSGQTRSDGAGGGGAVAVEAIAGQQPAQRLVGGIERHLGAKGVDAGGQFRHGGGEVEAVAGARGGGAPAEQRRLGRAGRAGQDQGLAEGAPRSPCRRSRPGAQASGRRETRRAPAASTTWSGTARGSGAGRSGNDGTPGWVDTILAGRGGGLQGGLVGVVDDGIERLVGEPLEPGGDGGGGAWRRRRRGSGRGRGPRGRRWRGRPAR